MKKLLVILLFVIGCAGDDTPQDSGDAFADVDRIGEFDGGSDVLNLGDPGPNEFSEYGCAKVFVQIPYEIRNEALDEPITMYSHRLWSVPVRRDKRSENNKWIAFHANQGTEIPRIGNADFSSEENDTVYAIVILPDGTELIGQAVKPEKWTSIGISSYRWQICEEYICGVDGCQSHPDFENHTWKCYDLDLGNATADAESRCPCSFDNDYAYCLSALDE